MQKIMRLFSSYVIVFILISCICALVYGASYQVLRQSANDPQIQIAEDGVEAVKAGQKPSFGPDKIDLAKNLNVFLAVYDKDGNPIDSNANVDGQLPKPPKGVFDYAKEHGQNRLTWQPKDGVRQALIVASVGDEAGQFVAVGRSLRDVDIRLNQILLMTLVAWGVMIVVSFSAISMFMITQKNEHHSVTHG